MLWFRRNPHPTEADISSLIDEQLAPSRRAQVEAHLQTCESCRGLLEELRQVRSLVSRLPQVEPSRSFVLSAEVAGLQQPAPAPRRSLAFVPAAALTLLVALLVVDFGVQGGATTQRDEAATNAVALTQEGSANGAGASALSAPAEPPISGEAGAAAGAELANGGEGATDDADAQDGKGGLVPEAAGTPAQEEVTSAFSAEPSDSTREAPVPSLAPVADADEDEGLSTLRALELLAVLVLLSSAVYVFGPRFVRKGS